MIVLAVHVRFKLLMDGGFNFWVKSAILNYLSDYETRGLELILFLLKGYLSSIIIEPNYFIRFPFDNFVVQVY